MSQIYVSLCWNATLECKLKHPEVCCHLVLGADWSIQIWWQLTPYTHYLLLLPSSCYCSSEHGSVNTEHHLQKDKNRRPV